jgi:hypothetical protein
MPGQRGVIYLMLTEYNMYSATHIQAMLWIRIRIIWLSCRRSQRDVVYLGTAPSYMRPNAGGGRLLGLTQ